MEGAVPASVTVCHCPGWLVWASMSVSHCLLDTELGDEAQGPTKVTEPEFCLLHIHVVITGPGESLSLLITRVPFWKEMAC